MDVRQQDVERIVVEVLKKMIDVYKRQGYALMTGDVAAVNAAVEAGSTAAAESGLLVSKVVIPSPAETVFEQIA